MSGSCGTIGHFNAALLLGTSTQPSFVVLEVIVDVIVDGQDDNDNDCDDFAQSAKAS